MQGVAKDTQPYFRDVYDHLLRASDAIESYDKLLSDVLAGRSCAGDRAPERGGGAAERGHAEDLCLGGIALVPTAIAGIYGMNFDYMPELRWRYGYFLVIAIIVTVCVVLHRLFRRNGWL